MRRKEANSHKRRRMSNRNLSDKYFYVGEHETVTGIRLTQYNEATIHTREIKTTDTFNKLVDTNYMNWFQVSGLTDAEAITRIVQDFGLHNLDAKDILTPQHVVKIEEYESRLLIILNSCYYDANTEIRTEHISILVAGDTVITFTESSNPVFEATYKALESNMLSIRKKGSGLLLAFLLNTIIANIVESVTKVEEMLEDIEETLLDIKNSQENMGSLIQQRRHEYMIIRKNSQPLKEQFSKLLRSENGIISSDILPIYNDLADQLSFIIQSSESCREIISSLVDLYISNNDLRMNAIMKRLTIVSTLFIPLTFLVGVWGMNFKFMPELDWRYGYIIAWSVMVICGVITWLYMKKKDWY
ncbi:MULTISPECIES: magnesium/cobalt transporter CorA [Parabacteroides]|uniref:magnesium/cobalt transporter CorA n=1 Tax=Parabacteroides provencensis TaxID=1944636 RepID=UPI000C152CBB|nr:magnesium/cobalt transporter CorA [Parabacteroides provencensis]